VFKISKHNEEHTYRQWLNAVEMQRRQRNGLQNKGDKPMTTGYWNVHLSTIFITRALLRFQVKTQYKRIIT